MLVVHTSQTTNCSTPLLYLLAYLKLKFQIRISEKLEPKNKLDPEIINYELPFIEDKEKGQVVYGLLNCMWYAVKKTKEYSLAPNEENMSIFFLIKDVVLSLNKEFDRILLKDTNKDVSSIKHDYNSYLNNHMPEFEHLDAHFAHNRWILGEQISFLDFLVAERLTKLLFFEQDLYYEVLLQLANLCSYTNRLLSIEKVELFREEDDHIERPFFDPKLC